jgi:hypothetical protein
VGVAARRQLPHNSFKILNNYDGSPAHEIQLIFRNCPMRSSENLSCPQVGMALSTFFVAIAGEKIYV